MRLGAKLFGLVVATIIVADVAAQPSGGEVDNRDVAELRNSIEASMSTLGELGNAARRQSDLVQATCVLDAQERADAAMELATSELLVLGNASAGAEARGFALEKLRASADRLDTLVAEASRCATGGGPEAVEDEVTVDVITPRSIPLADPTQGLGASPLPPVLDGGWVPSASPME